MGSINTRDSLLYEALEQWTNTLDVPTAFCQNEDTEGPLDRKAKAQSQASPPVVIHQEQPTLALRECDRRCLARIDQQLVASRGRGIHLDDFDPGGCTDSGSAGPAFGYPLGHLTHDSIRDPDYAEELV